MAFLARLSDAAKAMTVVVSLLFGVAGATWGMSQTIVRQELEALTLKHVMAHDQQAHPHANLTAQYPSPNEHQKEIVRLNDFMTEVRGYHELFRTDMDTIKMALARVEGRQKAKAFIRGAAPAPRAAPALGRISAP